MARPELPTAGLSSYVMRRGATAAQAFQRTRPSSGPRRATCALHAHQPARDRAAAGAAPAASSTSYQAAQFDQFETQIRNPCPRLCGDRPVLHGDVLERTGVRGLQAKQVVAAVLGRPEHGARARAGAELGGVAQHRGRQGRAVGIQHDRRAVAASEQCAARRAAGCGRSPARRRDVDRCRRQAAAASPPRACRRTHAPRRQARRRSSRRSARRAPPRGCFR